METLLDHGRQLNGFKHCSQAYLTYRGNVYKQWADRGTKKEAKDLVAESEVENPTFKFMVRKRDNFYRVYFTELKK